LNRQLCSPEKYKRNRSYIDDEHRERSRLRRRIKLIRKRITVNNRRKWEQGRRQEKRMREA
jgi:hypothetical protein